MMQFLSSTSTAVGDAWCRVMHSDPMWPVNGEYQCRTCLRKFRVAWDAHELPQPVVKQKPVPGAEAIAAVTVQSL